MPNSVEGGNLQRWEETVEGEFEEFANSERGKDLFNRSSFSRLENNRGDSLLQRLGMWSLFMANFSYRMPGIIRDKDCELIPARLGYISSEIAAQEEFGTVRLSQSGAEFHKTIDETVKQAGFSLRKVRELYSTSTEAPRTRAAMYASVAIRRIVYIRLRSMGYNHYPDLVQ